jgi:alanine dehydrogenase
MKILNVFIQLSEIPISLLPKTSLKNIEIKVFDQQTEKSLAYIEEFKTKLGMNICLVETIGEATEADIVVTTTSSRKPIFKKEHIRPGTHINAVGADAKGKQELETALLTGTKVVVDDIKQASHSGEINVPLSEGLIKV